MEAVRFESLGRLPYRQALELQKKLQQQRALGNIPDTVLLLEHPKVITKGRRNADADFRVSPGALRQQGFDVADAGRGGKLTYHGPGQLVGYFIVTLAARRLSVPCFVEKVERIVIETLQDFGITARLRPECPGVWVQDRKIASVGFSISRGVSMHGVALNVDPDLADFEVIVPCGIQDCAMTSMARELGQPVDFSSVQNIFEQKAREAFV